AAAHRRGIVHCDLKPANLMFRRDADLPGVEIMLGDFGVAHLPDETGKAAVQGKAESGPVATKADSGPIPKAEAVGTLAYMAPDHRAGTRRIAAATRAHHRSGRDVANPRSARCRCRSDRSLCWTHFHGVGTVEWRARDLSEGAFH